MTDTAAAFCDGPYDGRIASFGGAGRMARAVGGSLAIGLGAVAAVGLLATFVALAAAWILSAALSPRLHPTGAMALETVALADTYPTLAGTSRFSGASVALAAPADARQPVPATKSAMAPDSTPVRAEPMPVAPRPPAARVQAAPTTPLPPVRPKNVPQAPPQHKLARVPDPAQVAKPTPAAAPVSTLPLSPPVVAETASAVSLPPSRPLGAPPEPPKEETDSAPMPAGEGAPKIAAVTPAPVTPPPPVVRKSAPPQRQAHNKSFTLPGADSRTAVYDISARTVYMPNGAKLEAHSGLYDKMDDPRYVHVRMRGPTPPNVYDLTLREKLFHGVRAIRLNPVDEGKMFGRDGMLAHTYMLGPNGQSNGCVSFKDYDKFLQAYLRGEVDRLVVVPHLGDTPVPVAARSRRPPVERRGPRYAAINPPGAYIAPTW